MAESEYAQLMYFYRSFFKEIFGEAMSLMGRKGMLAILKTAARRFAENKLKEYKAAQRSFNTALKILLSLGKPEILEGESIITLKKCPFKTRPVTEGPSLEEDVFCNICLGFINGISVFFKRKPVKLIESRVRKAKKCVFTSFSW